MVSQVKQRFVLYVSGFDPKGASHYHALYRDQSVLQVQAGGLPLKVGARRRLPNGNACWDVHAVDAGVDVRTHYEFMRWDDVVRAHWPRHQWQLWRDVILTTVFNLRHGALWKMYQLSWPPAVALTMPFVLLCAVLAGMPLFGALAGWLALKASAHGLLSVATGLLSALLLGWLGRRLEARYSMYWMMRSYTFTARQALGRTPDLEERLDQQATRIAERLRQNVDDEVLVVGHSSGAIMAVIVMARALQLLPETEMRGKAVLSLLTLGQWIPLLGLLPQAQRFRDELASVATAPGLNWIDFSAPPDGCCFALTDPVAGSGLRVSRRAEDRPKLLSPRFAEMFDSPNYRALRRNKFQMHFQYLMASPRPVEYDYFRITGGVLTMGHRFAASTSVTGFHKLRLFRSMPKHITKGS